MKVAASEYRRLGIAVEALKCFEIESEVAGVLCFERREDVLICWPTLVRMGVAIGREMICANIPLSEDISSAALALGSDFVEASLYV